MTDGMLSYAGGLIGYLDGGTVTACSAHGSVQISSEMAIWGGGLCGYLKRGTIENCSVACTITAQGDRAQVGKLVGGKI